MIDGNLNNEYLLSTQHQLIGGFSKWPDCHSGEYVILNVFLYAIFNPFQTNGQFL